MFLVPLQLRGKLVEVVVAAIGAVVGDFGLVDLGLVLGYLLVDLHLLF
jgi:hypothetical protein